MAAGFLLCFPKILFKIYLNLNLSKFSNGIANEFLSALKPGDNFRRSVDRRCR